MKKWQLALLGVLFCAAAYAQEADMRTYPSIQLGGAFHMGVPMDDFRDNLDQLGIGAGGFAIFNVNDSPLNIGIELAGLGFDSEQLRYQAEIGGFLRRYELRTTSSAFLGHALVRFQPNVNFAIKPYVDGMLGFKNLFTRTTLTDEDLNETVDSGNDQRDWALSYGGAVGVQVAFSRAANLVLDLRCTYLQGSNASYLVRREETGVNIEDPIDAFEERTSPTTLLIPQIGITFRGLFEELFTEDEYDN
jgi:hypothetical protein